MIPSKGTAQRYSTGVRYITNKNIIKACHRWLEIGLISSYLISMWKKFVKDYLSFTKKDRVGVIVLVTLILIVVLLPRIWPAKKTLSTWPGRNSKNKVTGGAIKHKNTRNQKMKLSPIAGNYPAKKKLYPGKGGNILF